jgi:hypothetical protein
MQKKREKTSIEHSFQYSIIENELPQIARAVSESLEGKI